METFKSENTLKMTHVTSKKQQCQKNKRALGSGRHLNKIAKKTFYTCLHVWLLPHSMS